MSDAQSTALPLNFCLEGFRLIRQNPRLIAFWGTVTLFGNGVAILLAVALAGPSLQSLGKSIADAQMQPELLAMLLQSAMPGIGVFLVISAVTAGVIAAAVCRAVMGEDDAHLGFLHFGVSEVRLAMVNLLMTAFSIVIIFACFVIASIPAALFRAVPGATAAFAALAVMAAAGLVFWLRVRLSLNVAQSFATGRLDVFGSFSLTRGHFRQLAFGIVTAFVLAIVVEILCAQVTEAILTLLFGDITPPDLANLTAFLTPANTLNLILTHFIVSPLISAILYGAPVAAYSRLTGKTDQLQIDGIF